MLEGFLAVVWSGRGGCSGMFVGNNQWPYYLARPLGARRFAEKFEILLCLQALLLCQPAAVFLNDMGNPWGGRVGTVHLGVREYGTGICTVGIRFIVLGPRPVPHYIS